MAIDSLLTDLMIESISVAAVASKDAYGKRTWGSPSTISNCRVQTGDHKILDSLGQEKVANGRIYVPGAPTLTLNDKITLPDGSSPPILSIERFGDENGSHHSVIHYGSVSA